VGAVALARRRGGVWLMLAAAVGIALMCRSLAANNFYDIWNPSAGLFPLLLLIFVCWSLACGDYRLLPLAVFVASFLAQVEDAFLPPTIAAMAVGLAGLAIARLRQRRRRPVVVAPGWVGLNARDEHDRGRRGRMWPWALAALLVLLLCWTPPAIDQVAHGGNFGLVVKAATKRKTALGSAVGVHAVVRTVGITPWWLTHPRWLASPNEPFVRKYDVRRTASTLANVSTVVILGWLLLAAGLATRRRRQDVAAGALLALALCAAVWSIAKATPTSHLLSATLGYTLWSATTVGMFVWLMALWTAVVLSGAGALFARARASLLEASRARPAARALGLALGAAAVLALAALAGHLGAAAGTRDEHAFEFAALKTINSRLGAVPAGHSVFLNARLDGLITPLRPEITYDLRRRGVRALGNGAYLRTGHWYERAEHPYDYIVWVYDNNRLPVKGARVIAVASIESGGRRHAVDVAISPVRPRGLHVPTSSATHAAQAHVAVAPATAASAPGGWAAPGTLAGCPPVAAPRVVFPSRGPSDATGAGAIVWSSRASCGDGAQGSTSGPVSLSLSAVGSGERVGRPSVQPLRLPSAPLVTAVGASFGRVAVALAPAQTSAGGVQPSVVEGAAVGKLTSVIRDRVGGQLALARAYLGDVALASVTPGAIRVRVQRYFRHRFGPARSIPIAAGRVTALTATMDYRSDVLLAWQQNGSIYAHMLRSYRRADPTQRLGPSGPNPQLQALVSDNFHGIVAWSSTDARARTRIHLDLSAAGVRFGAPRLLASYPDPARAGDRPGSLALVRLSSENVVLAWTAAERGRYVVRAAPAVLAATRPTTLLSDPARDAVLADLAPGPDREAVALWSSPADAVAAGAHGTELWAARTSIVPGDRLLSGQRARIAAAVPNGAASVAVDPRSDRAVAAWRTPGAGSRIAYAVGPGASGFSPAAGASGTHWLRITLAALAAVAALALAGALSWRRRHRATAGALRRRR
jgi:hypothetical protein